jgi:hypothetical protein
MEWEAFAMEKDPHDLTRWADAPRCEDRRLWWQKLADGIAEGLAGTLRIGIELWKACNWRSRWWWRNDDF